MSPGLRIDMSSRRRIEQTKDNRVLTGTIKTPCRTLIRLNLEVEKTTLIELTSAAKADHIDKDDDDKHPCIP